MIHKEKNQLILLQVMLFNNIYLKMKLIIILEKGKINQMLILKIIKLMLVKILI